MDNQIKDWKRGDQMFVSTRASDRVMECIQVNSCVTLTGPAGVGKSFIASHAALVLQTEGYNIIPVYSPTDIRDYYQPEKKTVFIVDDICGNFTVNQHQIEDWEQLLPVIYRIVEDKCCKIIVACRLQVYKDVKFNILAPFKSCECNLISDKLLLTAKEKNDMADMYMGTKSKNLNLIVVKRCAFFPLLCYLYHENNDIKLNVNEFFGQPFVVYKNELDNLTIRGTEGKCKICSLALCVIFNNRLNENWFHGKVTDQQRPIIEDTCDACGLNRSTAKAELKEALDTLEGTFICKRYGIYSTIHDKLFDFLAHYFGQKMVECLLEHGNSYLIHERFVWQKSTDDIEFKIEISDHYLESYLKRLIKDWTAGMVTVVLGGQYMKDASFREQLLQYLQQLDKSQQITLANTKDSMIQQDTNRSGDYPLIRACEHGYTVEVENPNVNKRSLEGSSPVHVASQNGHTDIVRFLIEANADIDLCDINWGSPLFIASCKGHTDTVRLLLERNANVNICDKYSRSPLYAASKLGHTDIVRFILARNGNVDLCDNYSCSPLYIATYFGHTDIVRLLLEKNTNLDKCSCGGSSPLYVASQKGNSDIVTLLINANVDLCDNIWGSPLYIASLNGPTEL
ncbi:Hypothetical predicted protein [Mytilus galloprovincialis]|uniref:Novel STAND NTPase 3 domain-containing protein n=1 Tax=Mytilus galloprovincialis TaxID=29158 RepID=A0A8B6E5G8_MYTGA|nr:Hypothetical predicted protein [Mytilus galloprovincialis]